MAADARAILTNIYTSELGRAPDPGGLEYYIGEIQKGRTADDIRGEISASVEGRAFDARNPADVVSALYQQELGRSADPGGLEAYTNLLAQGKTAEDIRQTLNLSEEGRTVDAAAVQRAYMDQLGREADPGGLNFYLDLAQKGYTQDEIERILNESAEGRQFDSRTLEQAYRDVLNRGVDDPGMQYWLSRMQGDTSIDPRTIGAFLEGGRSGIDVKKTVTTTPGGTTPGGTTPGGTTPPAMLPGGGIETKISQGIMPQRVIIGGAPVTLGGGFAAYPYDTQGIANQYMAPARQLQEIASRAEMPPGLVAPPVMTGARAPGFVPFTSTPVVPFTSTGMTYGAAAAPAGGVTVNVPTTATAPRVTTSTSGTVVNPRVTTTVTSPTPTVPVTTAPVTPTTPTTPTTPVVTTPVVTTPTTGTPPVVNVTTPTTPTRVVTNPTPTPDRPGTGGDSATIRAGSVTPATTFVSPFFSNPTTSTGGGIYTTEQAVSESGQGISSTLTDIGQALSSYGEMPYLPGGLGLGILGNIITGQQADAMGNAADKLRNIASNPLPGVATISDRNGNVYTISNPNLVAASDVADFGTDILQTTNAPDGAGIDDERVGFGGGVPVSVMPSIGTGSFPLPGEEIYGDLAGFAQGGYVQRSAGIDALSTGRVPMYDRFGNIVFIR